MTIKRFIIVGIIGCAGVALFFWITAPARLPVTKPSPISTKEPVDKVSPVVAEPELPEEEHSVPEHLTAEFIETSDTCRVDELPSGAAVVAQNGENILWTRFDHNGPVFSKQLPFLPVRHTYFVELEDGRLLSILSDLRLDSPVAKPVDADTPAQVYIDDELIYETQKAVNLGVAEDGGAFFVIERVQDEKVNLIIHNLELDSVYTEDVSHLHDPAGEYYYYLTRMTLSGDAVWMVPVEWYYDQNHYLYPVNGAAPVTLDGNFSWQRQPVIQSLDSAFILNNGLGAGEGGVSFQRVDLSAYMVSAYADSITDTERGIKWTLELPGYEINPGSVSVRGEDVLLHHAGVRVLDIESGRKKFELFDFDDKVMQKHLKWPPEAEIGRVQKAKLTATGVELLREVGLKRLIACTNAGLGDDISCRQMLEQSAQLFFVIDVFDREGDAYSQTVSHQWLKEPNKCKRKRFAKGYLGVNAKGEPAYRQGQRP